MMLRDEAILVTPFELADAPMLMALDRDPDCARWFDFPPITMDVSAHRDHAERVIRRWWQEASDGSTHTFAIRVADLAVGMVALRRVRAATAAISYAIVAGQRGHGYATRATRLLARHGLDHLGFARIELRTDVDNIASQRVASRAGFQRVRLEPRAHKFEHYPALLNQVRDEYVYELTGS